MYLRLVEKWAIKNRLKVGIEARHSSRYGGVKTQLFDVVDLKVGVAAIAFVMGSSHELLRPSVVVSQNLGVKKPPAFLGDLLAPWSRRGFSVISPARCGRCA